MVSMEDPVVPLERNLYGHPLAGLLWERHFGKSDCNTVGRRFLIGNAYSYTVKKDYSYLCMMDDIKLAGKNNNIDPMWKVLDKEVDLGEPTSFLDHVYLGCTQRQCEISKMLWIKTEPCLDPEFPQEQLKNYHARKIFEFHHGPSTWKGMPRNVWNDLWVGKQDDSTTLQSINSMHWWPSFQRRIEICWRIATCMLSICSEMIILGTDWTTWYSVVSKQTCTIDYEIDRSCDKRLSRLISYIHHTSEYKQYCHVGNTPNNADWDCFKAPILAGDLEETKCTSGGTLCIFGSNIIHLFQ